MESKKPTHKKIFEKFSEQISKKFSRNSDLLQKSSQKNEELAFKMPAQETSYFPKSLIQPKLEKINKIYIPEDLNPFTLSRKNIKDEKEDYEILLLHEILDSELFMNLFSFFKSEPKQFLDKDFLPNDSSLYGQHLKKIDWGKIIWLRPSQFFEGISTKYKFFLGEYKVFQKNLNCFEMSFSSVCETLQNSKYLHQIIQPQDILQGKLDNCYFLASLSSLAEYPKRVKDLFITRKVNNFGIYCVKICFKAQWQAVYIDDYFPCDYYIKGNGNELWVLILEKAYAKLHGCYSNIEKGLTRKALRELTGAPTKAIKTDSPNIWQEIFQAAKKGYILTASSGEDVSLDSDESFGLVPKHAYSIFAAFEITKKEFEIKLIKLRNPWGFEAWKGPWSAGSKEWTKDLKEKLNYHNYDENQGIFFMELKEVFI